LLNIELIINKNNFITVFNDSFIMAYWI